jgi:hypothetical protein
MGRIKKAHVPPFRFPGSFQVCLNGRGPDRDMLSALWHGDQGLSDTSTPAGDLDLLRARWVTSRQVV